MVSTSQPILSNTETMDMLIAFYSEALVFLEVPKEQWAVVKMRVSINKNDRKDNIISIDYEGSTIWFCLPVLRILTQVNNNNSGDAPSVYRFHGYKLARLWQQYLKTGQCRIYEKDKDSYVFAMALGMIKGLPQVDMPVDDNVINTYGFNPFDRNAAICMLRDEFGIDCCIKQFLDLSQE